MKLADVSVRRPVFALMMTAALIVLGWFSYRELGLDLMPKTDYPVVIGEHEPARRERRRDRDAAHQADRRGRQHDQRHRRAARELGPGELPRQHHLQPRAGHRDRGRRTSATRWARSSTTSRRTRGRRSSRRSTRTPRRSSRVVVSAARSPKEITEIADKRIKQVLETVKDVGEVTFTGERRREIQVLRERRPAERVRPHDRPGAERRAAAERRGARRQLHHRARPRSRCARWGASTTSETSTGSSSPTRDGSVITLADVGRVLDTVQEPRSSAAPERQHGDLDVHPEAVGHQHGGRRRRRPGPARPRCGRRCRRTSISRRSAISRASSGGRSRTSSCTCSSAACWPPSSCSCSSATSA